MTTKKITDRTIFTDRPTPEVAKYLIGKLLCHKAEDDFVIKGRIKATEAYEADDGVTDANRSKNGTSQSLPGGHLHFHYQTAEGRKRIDIVTNQAGVSESVLIAEIDGYDGPQKTVWAMDIGQNNDEAAYDGLDLLGENSPVWLEDDGTSAELNDPSPRKGVSESTEKKLRFSAKKFIFQS